MARSVRSAGTIVKLGRDLASWWPRECAECGGPIVGGRPIVGIAMIGAGCGRGVGSGHHGPEEGVRPQMIEAVVFDDPAPGTTVTLGDGLVETYLGHGIWQTISAGSERD